MSEPKDTTKTETLDTSSLGPDIVHWVEAQTQGTLCELERHVARREAWNIAVRQQDGSIQKSFLRLDRNPVAGSRVSLEREARICAALQHTNVPVPEVLGWDKQQQLALFERVAGQAAIDKLSDAGQQRLVMEDFIDAVARLHLLSPEDLGLDDVLGTHALTARNCALDDLEGQLSQFAAFLKNYRDPLMLYGVQWLRRCAPDQIAKVALVQGDTGPVNFMFSGNKVTALVDWEWGHWGDPMEDLGNICVREFWNPSGGLTGLFERYERQSGIAYTAEAARYYRVQQNVRGMIPIHAVCQTRGMRESMAWYLSYREVGDRATCEALAQAMQIEIERPTLPKYEKPNNPLIHAALLGLERDIAPELSNSFSQSRAVDIGILVECHHREHEFAAELQEQEADEIATLLGQKRKPYQESNHALCDAIEEQRLNDTDLIRYLSRRAYRREWLYWPAAQLYPDRQWSDID